MDMIVRDIIGGARPLVAIGFDPSTKEGARLQAARLRLYWLDKGFDVRVDVVLSVPAMKNGEKLARDAVWGPKIDVAHAKKIGPDAARMLRKCIELEITEMVAA